jgi:hypothetical protein
VRLLIGLVFGCLVFLGPGEMRAQQSGTNGVYESAQNGAEQAHPLPGSHSEPEDSTLARAQRDMAKHANQERQAQLKRDTERLVKLADELKDYVDKSNEGILSLDVVKKAEEIEKLAHSVKEKMKGQ